MGAFEKSGHELVLDEPDVERIFPVSAYSLGYVRDIIHGTGVDVGLGGQITIDDLPDSLERYYGNDHSYSFQVFLRVCPSVRTDGINHPAAGKGVLPEPGSR